MLISNVIKHVFIRHPYVAFSVTVSHVANTVKSSDFIQRHINALFLKPPGLNIRKFSCTCVTGFRTANSFVCCTDNDDSESAGKSFPVVKKSYSLPV